MSATLRFRYSSGEGSLDESRLENDAATSEIVEDILVRIRDKDASRVQVVRHLCGLVLSSLSAKPKDNKDIGANTKPR